MPIIIEYWRHMFQVTFFCGVRHFCQLIERIARSLDRQLCQYPNVVNRPHFGVSGGPQTTENIVIKNTSRIIPTVTITSKDEWERCALLP